ncbi:MAG TPA: zinc ribbon domain-containing protein [Gemmatimonadales bacterium]
MTSTRTCPSCGAAASGRFCSNCGAVLAPTTCPGCGATRDPGARFCPGCGRPASATGSGPAGGGRSAQTPWLLAGAAALVAGAAIAWAIMSGGGNASATPDAAAAAGAPPDISAMTPRERFDRLFNRVMAAAENGDSAEVRRFLPMAQMAYGQLPAVDADARYHMAMLHVQGDESAAALAQADTIAAATPQHLFVFLIREADAARRGDRAAAARAREAFLGAYDAEIALERPEYAEHRGALDRFRGDALSR